MRDLNMKIGELSDLKKDDKFFICLKPHCNFEVIKYIDNDKTLNVMQNAVGGNIELVSQFFPNLEKKGIDVWVNDEGKLNGLEMNIAITSSGKIVDILMGNLLFSRCDEEGETLSCEESDFDLIISELTNKNYLHLI